MAEDWNKTCLAILNRKVSLWDEFYRNIFRERVEALISQKIEDAIGYLMSNLTSSRYIKNDESVTQFIWAEPSINDNPLEQSSGQNKQNRELSSLELKARSYPPTVQMICQQFDERLHSLIGELSEYVGNSTIKNDGETDMFAGPSQINRTFFGDGTTVTVLEDRAPFLLSQDNTAILEFVEKSILKEVKLMLEETHQKIGSDIKCELEGNGVDGYVKMARLCQAIPELCPSLQACASASTYIGQGSEKCISMNSFFSEYKNFSTNRSNRMISNRDTVWKDIKTILYDECCFLFLSWIGCLIALLRRNLKEYLADNFEANLNFLPKWESVEISEEGEGGTQVKSTIRIPHQISVGLQHVLYQHANSIYLVGSHNLPPKGYTQKYKDVITIN